jgi:hypothetical protein
MNPFIRSIACAAVLAPLAAAPALADAPRLPMRSGEVATPSALAAGEQYVSISKLLTCDGSTCTAKIKGRAKKQTLISQVSCLTIISDNQVSYGAMTLDAASMVALAIFPVTSRTLSGTQEYGVVGGPAQVVIGPDDTIVVGIQATGEVTQALCSLQGTTTKE